VSDGSAEAAAITGAIELIKLGSGNTRIRKAGDNVAYAAEVLTGIVKTALLPLAVVNARAEAYFQRKFPEQLAEALTDVAAEDIIPPKPSVAGPALQGLGYSHEEDALRELYVQLLATAMNGPIAPSAHPGFAEVIGALSAAEVELLNVSLQMSSCALREVRVVTEGADGWQVGYRHLTNFLRSGVAIVGPMVPAYIDNWARLGLIEIDYGSHLVAEGSYDWVTDRPEFIAVEASLTTGQTISDDGNGIFRPTSFGTAFAKAVGIIKS
jgi:hypothetical protein